MFPERLAVPTVSNAQLQKLMRYSLNSMYQVNHTDYSTLCETHKDVSRDPGLKHLFDVQFLVVKHECS